MSAKQTGVAGPKLVDTEAENGLFGVCLNDEAKVVYLQPEQEPEDGFECQCHQLVGRKKEGNEQLEPHEQAELAPLHSQPDMVIVCGLLESDLGG